MTKRDYYDTLGVKKGFLPQPDDLSQLKHIPAQAVKDFVNALNATTDEELDGRKLVAALGTGGTISMKVEDGIRIPDLDFDTVFSQTNSHLSEKFLAKSLDAFRLDSADLNYSHVKDLAIVMTYVWRNVTVPFCGFLILHGTDTLAYASAAMSLIMGQGLPFSIVYTAAQKSIQEMLNDAATNLRNALFTLESLYDANMAEVVVVMGDYAMLATSSVKIDDTAANAFNAPLHKYITTFNHLEYPLRLASWLAPRRKVPFEPTIWKGDYTHTLVIQSALGLNPELIARQIKDDQIQSVLIYSYGSGTVYTPLLEHILPVIEEKSIPCFTISPVNTEYKVAYASGAEMIKQGVVPLYMTMPATLAKMEIALRMHAGDTKAITRFMTTNYVGEIPTEQSRFVPMLQR